MNILKKVTAVLCALAVAATITSPISLGIGSANAETAQQENTAAPLTDEQKTMSDKCGDNLTWTLDENGTLTISGTGEMTDYGYGNPSPWNHGDVVSITIEDGVTSIGKYAFKDCYSLTSVTIPNSVTRIGGDAFHNCSSLISVTISDSVTNIGDYGFANCSSLTSITIPGSVTGLGYGAFADCSGLTSIIIPNCRVITWGAFTGCSGLTSMIIPDGVTRISENAFSTCSKLMSITIPKSVTRISNDAFWSCSGLKDVYYSGSESEWKSISIGSNNSCLTNATIHYNSTSANDIGKASGKKVTFNGHTYQVFKFDNVTSRDVISYCKKIGGYMAHINDAEENAFLSNYILESNIGYAYFGYTDEKVEGEWKWVDDKNSSYTNWAANEPNDEYGKEDYALIHQSGFWNDGKFESDASNGGVFVICEWEGDESTEQDIENVHFLSSYDPENGKVRFDESSTHIGPDYTLSDTIDKTAVPSMLNKYVIMKTDDNELFTVTDLKPVESKIGTISAIDKTASTITIDGEVYPSSKGIVLLPGQHKVLYHTFNGTVVDLDSVEEKLGTVECWVYDVQELTIDGKIYPANFLTDISFLANFDELLGKKVAFNYINGENYSPVLKVEAYNGPISPSSISVPFAETDMGILWRDGLFSHSTFEYDNDLAIAALVLSGAAEDNTPNNVKTVLNNMGFDNKSIVCNKYNEWNPMQPAYAFATKRIIVNGEVKTLVSITVRGSTSAEDWLISDFIDGATQGFSHSTHFLYSELLSYLNRPEFEFINRDDMLFFITGHSLGGAVAGNLTASMINNNIASQENIFAYTFASPNYTIYNPSPTYNPYPSNKTYSNLFEIINKNDVVPKVGAGSHKGMTKSFVPGTGDFYSYWHRWAAGVLIPLDKAHNHMVTAYMAYLLTNQDFTQIVDEGTSFHNYLINVRCPVDVEIYDIDDTLIAKVANNIMDNSVIDGSVFCKIEGDEKYFFAQSDKDIYLKFTGTDNGTMEYSVQKLKPIDEVVTEEDFVTYKSVTLEKGKEFYSDITQKDDTSAVSLYVIDPETNQSIKTVELDGTEVPISLENTYKITFDANGGTASDIELSTDITGKLSKLPTATRTNYTFDGWFTSVDSGEKITTETVFTADTTVYAHWTKNNDNPEHYPPSNPPKLDYDYYDDYTSSNYDTSTSTDNSSDFAPETSVNSSENISSDTASSTTDVDIGNDVSESSETPESSDESTVSSSTAGLLISSGNNTDSETEEPTASDNTNPLTGVMAVIAPILIVAGAYVVIFRKKNKK